MEVHAESIKKKVHSINYKKKEKMRVIICTESKRIEADVYGERGMRLSDMLNNAPLFIPVTDAVVYDLGSDEEPTASSFMTINKNYIVMAVERQKKLERPS